MTSVNSIGSSPAELSMVRETSARPRAGRFAVPAKMTSSIFWLRTALGAWAPSTQAMASTTLDLPEPLGPTTTVTPGSSWRVVASANDLNPLRVSDFKNTAGTTLAAPSNSPQRPSSRRLSGPTIWAPPAGSTWITARRWHPDRWPTVATTIWTRIWAPIAPLTWIDAELWHPDGRRSHHCGGAPEQRATTGPASPRCAEPRREGSASSASRSPAP